MRQNDEVPGSEAADVCVVGAGLIGLATARALSHRYEGISLLILEKEAEVARHQSSHNSGVVHSGLYYKPGSLKAELSVEGREAMYRLCAELAIPHRRSGKLVIATDPSELDALSELERRGRANGLVDLERIGPSRIRELEPHATGLEALYVPEAGVADFPAVANHMERELGSRGAMIEKSAQVTAIEHHGDRVRITAGQREFEAKTLVNCAGLHSDRVAWLAGVKPSVRIIPFRGEYYRLSEKSSDLVKTLIYPVPDPRFPFLGVHFTRRVDGTVEVGPNAVLALGREHYRGKGADWTEVRSILGYAGFRKLALTHWLSGAKEILNSRSKTLYARLARRLLPELSRKDLIRGGAGIRAQAVDQYGKLVDDFVIERAGRTIHVLNAPSPGATASLAIGGYVADQIGELLLD